MRVSATPMNKKTCNATLATLSHRPAHKRDTILQALSAYQECMLPPSPPRTPSHEEDTSKSSEPGTKPRDVTPSPGGLASGEPRAAMDDLSIAQLVLATCESPSAGISA